MFYFEKVKNWWSSEAKNEELDLPLDNEIVKKMQPRQQGYFVGLPSYAVTIQRSNSGDTYFLQILK